MADGLDGSDEQPDDVPMDERIDRLEKLSEQNAERLTLLEHDVAIIRTNYVTKEDLHREMVGLHKEINTQTWRLVTFVCGFGTALVAATYFIATHVR